MLATSFRRYMGIVIVLAVAGLLCRPAQADSLDDLESGFLFTNNTKDFVDNLELTLTKGKIVGLASKDPNVKIAPQGQGYIVTGFNVPRTKTLTIGLVFKDFDGTGLLAKWTKGFNFAGNIATPSSSVAAIDHGGGVLEPRVTMGNDNPDTLTFSSGYTWVPSSFDVFNDALPSLTPLPDLVLSSGSTFTFTGLNQGMTGQNFLLVSTATNSLGQVESTFENVYGTAVPEPSAIIPLSMLAALFGAKHRMRRSSMPTSKRAG